MPRLLKQSLGLALALALSSTAHASYDCNTSHGGFRTTTSDSWTGTDKLEHFAVSLPFGAFGGWITRDTDHPVVYGTMIGTVPGLAKEIYDGTCRGNGFSYKDLFADAVGALTDAWAMHWAVAYNRDKRGTMVGLGYHDSF
ncbi:hypothetical protein [Paraburkholderia dinghuensis]|uniref:DUF2279 domain-containing protein n=1 Tax=Paraburkholderia dinghuensis TaxID=2305225 RepID=A0A3N6NA61_9BURK|nr:hypothetical protein [Paraburkholderia dinghuensis]RQH07981.1 hypothetical protein D1Y85_07715 [Paraburkholderia dinghuensis]